MPDYESRFYDCLSENESLQHDVDQLTKENERLLNIIQKPEPNSEPICTKCKAIGAAYKIGTDELESLRAQVETLQNSVSYWQKDSAAAWDKCEERRLEGVALKEQNALLTLQAQQLAAALKPFCDGDVPDDDSPENYVMNAKAALSALTTYIQAADSVAVQEPVYCVESEEWVLVKVRPTKEMLESMQLSVLMGGNIHDIWSCGIAASPTLDKE